MTSKPTFSYGGYDVETLVSMCKEFKPKKPDFEVVFVSTKTLGKIRDMTEPAEAEPKPLMGFDPFVGIPVHAVDPYSERRHQAWALALDTKKLVLLEEENGGMVVIDVPGLFHKFLPKYLK